MTSNISITFLSMAMGMTGRVPLDMNFCIYSSLLAIVSTRLGEVGEGSSLRPRLCGRLLARALKLRCDVLLRLNPLRRYSQKLCASSQMCTHTYDLYAYVCASGADDSSECVGGYAISGLSDRRHRSPKHAAKTLKWQPTPLEWDLKQLE